MTPQLWYSALHGHANLIHRVTNKNLTTLTKTKIEETRRTLKWTLRSLPMALAAAQTTPINPPLAPQKDGKPSNARPTHSRNKEGRDLTLGRVHRLLRLRVLHLRSNSEMSVRKTKRSMAVWWRSSGGADGERWDEPWRWQGRSQGGEGRLRTDTPQWRLKKHQDGGGGGGGGLKRLGNKC
jgi:hypothetical protein